MVTRRTTAEHKTVGGNTRKNRLARDILAKLAANTELLAGAQDCRNKKTVIERFHGLPTDKWKKVRGMRL